jgi:hypothetical protein
VWEDCAGGVDRVLALKTNEALAPSCLLLFHGVEAHLSGPGAADRHPVPVDDEALWLRRTPDAQGATVAAPRGSSVNTLHDCWRGLYPPPTPRAWFSCGTLAPASSCVPVNLLSRSITVSRTAIYGTQAEVAPYIMRLLSAAAGVGILDVRTRLDRRTRRPDH